MSSGDWPVFLGDGLVFISVVVALFVFWRQRSASRRHEIESALAVLMALRDGMQLWGNLYFGQSYNEQTARERAQQDFDWVMNRSYGQIFRVPTEPLTVLISQGENWLIREETVRAANAALWRIGFFNQLVQQQTDFNAHHLAEFYDGSLPDAQREALAEAARAISKMLHLYGIGDALWYRKLMDELDANVEVANRQLSHRGWLPSWPARLAHRFWKSPT